MRIRSVAVMRRQGQRRWDCGGVTPSSSSRVDIVPRRRRDSAQPTGNRSTPGDRRRRRWSGPTCWTLRAATERARHGGEIRQDATRPSGKRQSKVACVWRSGHPVGSWRHSVSGLSRGPACPAGLRWHRDWVGNAAVQPVYRDDPAVNLRRRH